GPAPLPAPAQLQEGPAAARGLPRRCAEPRTRGIRVPPRLVVRRRGPRRAAPPPGVAVRIRYGRGAGGAAGADRGLGLPAAPPRGLRRRCPARLGRADPRAAVERGVRVPEARGGRQGSPVRGPVDGILHDLTRPLTERT